MNSYKDTINKIRPELDKVINYLKKELARIQTTRVTPALVENIVVDVFGNKLPLKQLGAITTPEPRQIVIQPWDNSYIESIEKTLSRAGIGGSPVVDKDIIRINFPPLTEESRKNLLRVISLKQEEARKTVRRWREEAWREIQEEAREGKIREDDKYRAKDELQELIDEYNGKIEEMGERKKKEILE